jgi:uncharacterized BrkB/YihY/UPF0761 family membrane protein
VLDGPEEKEEQSFAAPMVGMLCGSLVIVAVIAILDSQIGRDLEDDIDAPARALVAVPVVAAAAVVFLASMLALVPDYRRPALRVAAIGGWLIAAWLVMAGMVLGAIDYALDHAS